MGLDTFYRVENSWVQGESRKRIDSLLSQKLGRVLSEYRFLKYANGTFFLFEAFTESIEFEIKATQLLELDTFGRKIKVQCIEIRSYLINLVFKRAKDLFAVTQNFLICFFFNGEYKVTIRTSESDGLADEDQGDQLQLKWLKLGVG